MHSSSSRSLRALISVSALAITSAGPLVAAAAHADTPPAHARPRAGADRDHDGMPNRWERRHGLNPNRANGRADSDHDGLSNRREFRLGLNPKVGDSDHDGLKDGREVRLGTDPKAADSDHDGLKDGLEVRLKTNPRSADSDHDGLKDGDEVHKYKTDPTKGDTDGDGTPDGAEVTAGTDPTAPTTQTPPTQTPPTQTPPPDTGGGTGTSVATPVITGPSDGAATRARPTISGTGVSGDSVTVTVTPTEPSPTASASATESAGSGTGGGTGGTVENPLAAGSAPTNAPTTLGPVTVVDGSWSVTPTTDLPEGGYTVTAVQSDASNNQSAASAPVTFTVDATTPEAPAITSPESDTSAKDNTPTVTGTGEDGATVTLTATPVSTDGGSTIPGDTIPGGDSGAGVATTSTDGGAITLGTDTVEDGTWSITPDETHALTDGAYTLTATQTDPAGNASEASDPVTLTIDATVPDAPVITPPQDPTSTDSTPTVTGTGEKGAKVTLLATPVSTGGDAGAGRDTDAIELGTDEVGQSGGWSITVDEASALANGEYTLTATQTDVAGNTSDASDPVPLTIDAVATPTVDQPTGAYVDVHPTFSGAGEEGATITLIVDGQSASPTAVVQNGGTWTITLDHSLAVGPHTVTATQTVDGESTGDASATVPFLVTSAPE